MARFGLGGVECRHRLLVLVEQGVALVFQLLALGDQFVANRFQLGQLVAGGQLLLGQFGLEPFPFGLQRPAVGAGLFQLGFQAVGGRSIASRQFWWVA